MSFVAKSQTNVTDGQQDQANVLQSILFAVVTTVPCCIFLYINGIMLFTLRSKPVFCDTSRYILLCNLLFADTVQMTISQLLFLLMMVKIYLSYPVCGVLVMLCVVLIEISPLTLVVMSLERYVAVCYPLRHSTIVTVRNTAAAVAVIWGISSLTALTRVILMLQFPFEELESLQMSHRCNTLVLVLVQESDNYEKALSCFLFISAFVAITSSYIGVTVAARSASTNKASSRKARNTLLLHLVQLGLSVLSTIQNPVLVAIYSVVHRATFVHIQVSLYIFIILLPKCLSALIYGLRDRTIRISFIHHLCFQMKFSVLEAKS